MEENAKVGCVTYAVTLSVARAEVEFICVCGNTRQRSGLVDGPFNRRSTAFLPSPGRLSFPRSAVAGRLVVAKALG